MYGFTKKYGKAICVVLYSVCAYYAAKKQPIPLIVLAAMHVTEFFTKANKIGAENGHGVVESFFNCLCFGFTWWLPVKKENI